MPRQHSDPLAGLPIDERVTRPRARSWLRSVLVSCVVVMLLGTPAVSAQPVPLDDRAVDGSGNNLANPSLGSALNFYARLNYGAAHPTGNAYADGIGAAARPDGPNTRLVSNVLAEHPTVITEPTGLNDMLAWWLFHVHTDIAVGLQAPAGPSIAVPLGDPDFDPTSEGTAEIAFRRSFSSVEFNVPFPTREIANVPTTFLDASPIYQTGAVDAAAVREGEGGRMKMQPTASGESVMPSIAYIQNSPGGAGSFNDPISPVPFPVSLAVPTSRAAFPGGASIHTLLLREHNRVADLLSALPQGKRKSLGIPDVVDDPVGHDEAVFQLARKIVEAEAQAITYDEVLPAIGVQLPSYSGYDAGLAPAVFLEFASGPLRLHTMLNQSADRVGPDGSTGASVDNTAIFAFGVPDAIYSDYVQAGIDPLLRGMLVTPAQQHDLRMDEGLRSINPEIDLGVIGDLNDLMATHIERGRDRGIPGYQAVRTALNLPTVASFDDVTSDSQLRAELASLYPTVSDIDPLVGMLAEDRVPGSLFGPTALALYQLQFELTRDSDRLWHQNLMEQSDDLRTAMRVVGLDITKASGQWKLNRTLAGLLLDASAVGTADITPLTPESEALTVQ